MAVSKAKIQTEIDQYQAVIDDANASAEEKDLAKDEINALKTKLQEMSGEKKPAKEKKPAVKKESKPRKGKIKYKSGEKDMDQMSGDECLEAVQKRRDEARKRAGKRKTKSVFTSIADELASAGKKAIQAIPKSDIKSEPGKTLKAMEKVSDILEDALKKIKETMKPYLENKDLKVSAEAQKDMDDLDKVIAGLRKKYDK